ncbi:2Fe-2S iron-sulfur cluster-binding protein [Sphingomicrobium lutaoense]|uniref:Ferredoxin n=1 Tax=Sphingomicrobium lutaoense TaxID=515949 RepID=A0A839Z281_9SPHN|nr:2Fe-2S iron-sulfur cluster-binding protein [Sphingomicrobium lutaoense]MBB3763762.1 ferredoxin [Sphingomicrobium lutaoense]
MTRVRFLKPNGEIDREVEAEPGTNLLALAQANGQPLEGTCEGSMACSTCHVIVADEDFDRLSPMCEEEDDLLDLAAHVTRHSRLACQVEVPADGTLTVRMPGEVHNLENR